MIIARAMLFAAISPINGVKTPPPIIAITINDPAIFVFDPSPLIPSAKIVGNINDIKKLDRNIDHTPIHPGKTTATDIRSIFMIA